MGSTQHAQDYFSMFPSFHENVSAPILTEFDLLAKSQGWGEFSKRYMKERKKCLRAQYIIHIKDYFDVHGGVQTKRLEKLQALCGDLGISAEQTKSINLCRKALGKVHINMIDLIDSRRAGSRVKVFHSHRALLNYTYRTEKYFPKDIAREHDCLKVLLRPLMQF